MTSPWASRVEGVKGNVSPKLKDKLVQIIPALAKEGAFADSTMKSLKATVFDVIDRPEDGKKQARVIFEVVVHEEMLNSRDTIHGGCVAYLVDACSSVAIAVLGLATDGNIDTVSQAINTIFHASAKLGDKLEIVSTTISSGARAVSAQSEIWDVTNHRLVASGTHIKMKNAKAPKPKL